MAEQKLNKSLAMALACSLGKISLAASK